MKRLYFMRKDLNMSPGKLAVMVGHGTELWWMNMFKRSMDTIPGPDGTYSRSSIMLNSIENDYISTDYKKIILGAKSKNDLLKIANKLSELGLKLDEDYGFIIDICLYETKPEESDGTTIVGIWTAPLNDSKSSEFKRYRLY